MNMYAVNECRCIKKNHTLSIIKKNSSKGHWSLSTTKTKLNFRGRAWGEEDFDISDDFIFLLYGQLVHM